jgi:ssRNA-specific RNase YbeY (16S rRNA maturation enzyme)
MEEKQLWEYKVIYIIGFMHATLHLIGTDHLTKLESSGKMWSCLRDKAQS